MNYNGIGCPYCKNTFTENDDVVVCPVCGTPHHRSCWQENGRCVNEDKHTEGFIWQTANTAGEPAVQGRTDNMKICPRCGEKNAPYEPVCIRCGERLKANRSTISDQLPPFTPTDERPHYGNYQTPPNPDNFSPYQNVYAADARTVFGEDAKIDDIPVSEVAEYVQKDSTKYIGRFLDMQKKKSSLSWNWSAFLGSAFWCFYRRISGVAYAVIAIFFSVNLISGFAIPMIYQSLNPEVYQEFEAVSASLMTEMEILASNPDVIPDMTQYYKLLTELALSPINITSYIVQIAAVLIINIILGFFGNHFYKKKVVKEIKKIRQYAVDSMTYHIYLRQRGNVSVINLMLPVLCYMLFSTLLMYF